jgi:hypothetical protein
VTGAQTIYLVNESVQWINVNWIEINRDTATGATPTPTPTNTPTRTPTPSGATNTPTPTPTAGASSWLRIEAETFTSAASGVRIFNSGDGGQEVGDFNSGRWIAFNSIDLLGGIGGLRVRAANTTNGTLTLRAGSATGTILCTLNWTTGSGYVTRETTCTPSLSGVQTIVLVNDSVQWINVNWIEINRDTATGATATPTREGGKLECPKGAHSPPG